MAGSLKPTGVREETTITLIASFLRVHLGVLNVANNISGLFDQSLGAASGYGDILMRTSGGDFIEFSCSEKIKIWSIANTNYSDAGGSSPKNILIEKWNGTAYVQIESRATKNDSTWYELTGVLTPGQYKIKPAASYVVMDEWYIEKAPIDKTLILSDGNYKKFNSATGLWEVVSTTLPTQAQFESEGMDTIPDWVALSQLSGEIEVVIWTDEENAARSINYNAVPQDQLVQMTRDINIRSIENIDSFTLNTLLSGQASVRTTVSFDSGTTWYTRSGTEWAEIEMNVSDMKASGMTPTVLNALTATEWTELRGLSDTVRFAYVLSAEEVTDTLEVRDLISQMDMRGTWKKAAHPTIYDYEYPYNDQLRVTIFASGDYKINY